MSKPAILSCGEVLWDLFPGGPRFGGVPADFACHAAIPGGSPTILFKQTPQIPICFA